MNDAIWIWAKLFLRLGRAIRDIRAIRCGLPQRLFHVTARGLRT